MSRNPPCSPASDRNSEVTSREKVRFVQEPTPNISIAKSRLSPESDEVENDGLSVQLAIEKKQRKKTIVNSFRLAELVPTTSTPYSSYRRKSIAFTVQSVVDTKAEEQ